MEDFLDINKEEEEIFLYGDPNKDENKKEKDVFYGLNKGQVEMVKGILEYVFTNKDKKDYFLIQGSSGTGKSYAIGRALDVLHGYSIIAAAPSHFAKNILKDFFGSHSIKVYTIAAAMGKKLTYNDKGKMVLVDSNRRRKPPIVFANIVIIDEASMIDDDMAKELLEKCRNKKLIVLGDYCQLPPVRQHNDSLFFDNISSVLTAPMRFKGHIFKLAEAIREQINKSRHGKYADIHIINKFSSRISQISEDGSGYIFLNKFDTFINAAIKRFKEKKGTQYVRVVAYRNKTIDTINKIIRASLYGKDAKQFEKGELLINEGGYKQDITNGQLLIVERTKNIIGPYDIPCLRLTFENSIYTAPVVSNEGMEEYNRQLNDLKTVAKRNPMGWEEYYAFIEKFAYFKYSYATSVHKVQGSSIRNIFIMEEDILDVKPIGVKEKLQSLYVAITRASYRVFIFNKNLKVNNKKLDLEYLKKR